MQKEIFLSYIKDMLTNSLNVLGDAEYQKEVWFGPPGKEISTYEDTVSHFLDRCEQLFEDPNTIHFCGEKIYGLLKELFNLVSEHLRMTENKINLSKFQKEDLLNDPNWQCIQRIAANLCAKLKDIIWG